VVIYLNGIEVLRDNMPNGPIAFGTPALSPAPDAGTRLIARQIQSSLLQEGPNVLAAEVHHSTTTTNLTFDLSLIANGTTPYYTQMFPPGTTAFAPQLTPGGSNGVPITQLLPTAPPGAQVSVWTPSGMLNEYFDPNLRRWQPGTTVLTPGYGAMLFNPTPNMFQVNISGWPAYPPQTLQLQRKVAALVARQTPAEATFTDIMGFAPQNGTVLSRMIGGQQRADYTFSQGAWQPAEPVAQLGEAVWITLPCVYLGGPSNIVVEAVSPQGAPLQLTADASSYCGGTMTLNCTPPQGAMLPLGTTTVSCQANDGQGNSASWSFTVNVVDTTPPLIQGGSDMVVECNANGAATVFYNVLATDMADPNPHLLCSPPSGSLLPIGNTVVQCTAWDANGNTNQTAFTVTVADTRAPMISCPGNVTLLKTRPEGAQFFYQLLYSDIGDSAPMVEYSMPPGSTFAPGTTAVTCAVTDASGNTSTCSFNVTVVSATPGLISNLNVAQHQVSLSIPTQAGVEYAIQYKNSKEDRTWQPLAFLQGNGSLMTVADPHPAPISRFYRVCAP